MCGIAGALGTSERDAVEAMTAGLRQRGPDGNGVRALEGVDGFFGHTRLSILDLSENGRQPMATPCGRYTITYNGEIYNFRELRRELEESRGVCFTSATDTEVLLQGYRCWGAALLERLRGMFAFAIWDRDERELFLARDRFGIKPLIYGEEGGRFIFASEVGALLASGLVARNVDPAAVVEFLAFGSVCQPRTIIEGLRQFEPGTWMKRGAGGEVETGRYWNLAEASSGRIAELGALDRPQQVEVIRAAFDEACDYHLVSDVPVGSFLSGGLDSSLITALLAEKVPGRMKTFSLGFADRSEMGDELSDARVAAEVIGTDHTDVVLENAQVPELFDAFIAAIDQPSCDGFNTFCVSREAGRHVKVVTSGLGADELFGGYSHFSDHPRFAGESTRPWDTLGSWIYGRVPNRFCYPSFQRSADEAERVLSLRRVNLDVDLTHLRGGAWEARKTMADFGDRIEGWLAAPEGLQRKLSMVECHHYLLNTLLRDSDVLSMASGLELRPIFLDHELAELAFALPEAAKVNGGKGKVVLRDLAKRLLPPEILNRPKRGFDLPQGAWLSTTLKSRLHEAADSEVAREFFSADYLKRCRYQRSRRRIARQAWALLVLVSWMEKTGCELGGVGEGGVVAGAGSPIPVA